MALFTLFALSAFLVSASFPISSEAFAAKVGVCYGQLGNDLPEPSKSVELIRDLKAKRVKIYDANPKILNALKGTDIQVSIMVPNEIITDIASSQEAADQWVKTNAVAFYPETKIRYLLVGNEILSAQNSTTSSNLVPAMRRIRYSCKKLGLKKVKVGTPLAMDVLGSSFPPSSGAFRDDVTESVLKPLLAFLDRTKSFFFVDAYPYFAWAAQPSNIDLNYALLGSSNFTYSDPGSRLVYTNLLDQMLDALYFAMQKLGYPNVRLFVAETGWPNGGDADQIGCTVNNAAEYNRNAARKFSALPALGTPAKPGVVIPAFVFSLFNENQKPGPGSERHFGLFYPNGTSVYEIDLSGEKPESEYKPLPAPAPSHNAPSKGEPTPAPSKGEPTPAPSNGQMWCAVAEGAKDADVEAALNYACGQGVGTCDAIQPGGICYEPNTLAAHANYAFSSYWAQFKKAGGTCYFDGAAAPTATDPSYGSCKFPSVPL